jgi:hypothetical protein
MAVEHRFAKTQSKECPSAAKLKTERFLDPGQADLDPWGGAYRIECKNEGVTVTSAGPDARWNTPDDIRAPPVAPAP